MELSEPAIKRFRSCWTSYESQDPSSTHSFTLTNLGEHNDDDDKESVHSWQSDETAWVADSGDDWEDSENEEESATEYEVAEDSEAVLDGTGTSSSSEFTDARIPDHLIVVSSQRNNDSSLLSEETHITDDESGSELFQFKGKSIAEWRCLKCGTPTAVPRMFCFTCNQKRMASWPPRPKRRTRKRKLGKAADAAIESQAVERCSREIGLPNESGENLCAACHVRKRDGLFYHGRTGHAVYCYACTKKIADKTNARCPVCRQVINRAVKLFFC